MDSIITTHGAAFAARSIALTLTCVLAAANSFAGQPDDQVPAKIVKFQDLNVDSPAGVAALFQRIHSAAKLVCNVDRDRSLAAAQRAKTCASEAEARAVALVNLPPLTAYYQKKIGRPAAVLAANHAE